MKQAWLLADRLHASIDYIVGRTEDDPVDAKGGVQCAYEALDPRLQQSFDDYLDYLIERNVQLRNERVAAELRRYDAACYRLELLFYAQMDDEGISFAFEAPEELRAKFQQFVEERADEKRGPGIGASADAIMEAYDRTHSVMQYGDMTLQCSTYNMGATGKGKVEYAFANPSIEKGASNQNNE